MDNLREELRAFKEDIIQVVRDEDRFTRELLLQEIRASEYRVKTELRKEFKQDLVAMKDEIITSVAEIIDGHVLPQIDDHEVRLTRLEARAV